MRPTAPALLATLITVLVSIATPAVALLDGPLAESPCLAGKLKCIAKTKSCLLACHVQAVEKGLAVDPACLAKCRDGFDEDPAVVGRGCFARVETHQGCGTDVGNAAEVAARIDAHVHELARQLAPGGSVPANPCSAKKIRCVRKYDDCVLKSARKAAQQGTVIDASKCLRQLDGTAKSCVGKLERKYCAPGDSACTSTATACLTFNDETQLRGQDDAFVDEVVQRLVDGARDVDTQRCSGDTSVRCTSAPGGAAGCGGGLGTCEFHLGPPTPLSLGGLSFCAVARWNGAISGTFDQASGASAGTGSILERFYVSPTLSEPCPRCQNDPVPNDGTTGGTCDGGTRGGLACDGNATSPTFGTVSLDCPPSANPIADPSRIDFDFGNAGLLAKTIDAGSPTCNGALGKRCACASCSGNAAVGCDHDDDCAAVGAGTCTSSAGEPRRPNACYDQTATPIDGSICMPAGGDEGVCPEDPFDLHCVIERFRGCTSDDDCPAENDRCTMSPRPCYPGYDGNVGDTLAVTGSHEAPRNGVTAMTFGALACQPPHSSALVNTVFGLPGPSRFALDAVGTHDGGPTCPTQVSFVPTSKGPVTDLGWSGLGHDQERLVGGAVTLATTCTGTHPNCSCSYSGPIANPNAP